VRIDRAALIHGARAAAIREREAAWEQLLSKCEEIGTSRHCSGRIGLARPPPPQSRVKQKIVPLSEGVAFSVSLLYKPTGFSGKLTTVQVVSFPGFVPDIAGPPLRRVAVFLGLDSLTCQQGRAVARFDDRDGCRRLAVGHFDDANDAR
jgi:hypothetical protein